MRRQQTARHAKHDPTTGRLLFDTGYTNLTPEARYSSFVRQRLWKFDKAGNEHFAVCRVAQKPAPGSNGTAAGSGALIWSDGKRGLVLTADHILRSDDRPVACHWPAGVRFGRVGARDPANDLAIIELDEVPKDAWVCPVEIDRETKPGDKLQFATYGAGQKVIRIFSGTFKAHDQHDRIVANVYGVPGDSGGPVFHDGRIVGVTVGAGNDRSLQAYAGGMFVATPTVARHNGPIKRFFRCVFGGNRSKRPNYQMTRPVQVGQCGPNTCGPQFPQVYQQPQVICPAGSCYAPSYSTTVITPQPSTGMLVDGNTGMPPATPEPGGMVPLPPTGPAAPPCDQIPQQPPGRPTNVEVEIDYGKLADLVYDRMTENPDSFRGEAGIDGQNGVDGQPGAPGAPGATGPAGPAGEQGIPGEMGLQGDPGMTRVDLVGEGGLVVETITPDADGVLRLPPVVFSIKWPDDRVFTQRKALGQEIRVKLVPVETRRAEN